MSTRSSSIALIRSANNDALRQARLGAFPDPKILLEANHLGDPALIAECQLCRATAMATAGYPQEGAALLIEIEATLADGLRLEPEWSWRHLNVKGLIADDFAEADVAWDSHLQALSVAEQASLIPLASISLSNLAYVSIQIGVVDDAMARLVSAMSNRELPADALASTHLVLSHLLSAHSSHRLAFVHRKKAQEFAQQTSPNANRRRLINIASAAIQAGETEEASNYVTRVKQVSGTTWSPLALITFSVLEAKLLHISGQRTEAIAAITQTVTTCDGSLTVVKESLITLAEFFLADEDFTQTLKTLDHPQLKKPPRSQEFQVLSIRRSAYQGLKQWKQAADCFEDLARLSKAQTPDVLTLYSLQCASTEIDLIQHQNQDLQDKNRELAALSRDKEAIMNMIANNLQSPLTALQLTIELLSQHPTPSNIERRVSGARRIVSRIKTVARHLSLAGEIEANTIIARNTSVWLPELFSRVESTAGPALRDRSMVLRYSVSDPVGRVDTDPERLQQLLEAILWGIAKFSRPSADVIISATPEIRLIENLPPVTTASIQITATELGLSTDALEDLRHKRAWSSPERTAAGAPSDISFYLADRLAAAIGTTLTFTPVGAHGTVFGVCLPVADWEPASPGRQLAHD